MGMPLTLIIGGVVGWLASPMTSANSRMGIVASIVVGIIGSIIGHSLIQSSAVAAQGQLAWWVAAVVSSALLIAVVHYLGLFGRLASARR